jgi:broad specificity phosphatase PhoE
MIKVCAQDAPHVRRLVRHIVGQLGDMEFVESYVWADTRLDDFLRAYGPADLELLHRELDALVAERTVDFWREAPRDLAAIRAINRRWFDCETEATHSETDVPVAPQLSGFEAARGDYLLQADVDVMIGRRDPLHDFLSDMLFALDADPRRVSVSFNIPHAHSAYVPYDAPEGGFVPEVRLCLLDRRKLLGLRPLPNRVSADGRLRLTWYRSLLEKQREDGWLSVRGGDGRSFFVHPMNTIKTDVPVWMGILDKIERGHIPRVQFERHDLVEDRDAWREAVDDPHERLILSPRDLLDELYRNKSLEPRIVALRHGEKERHRRLGAVEAEDTVGLTREGAREVEAFALSLPVPPRRILVAPLPRCLETARVVARAVGGVSIVSRAELLGASFHDRASWQVLKRHLGWSQLVARWIAGGIPAAVVTPYRDWIRAARQVIEKHIDPDGLTLIVTQGYLNSAFCHHLTGRVEYRGGPLHGFVWPA